MASFPEFVRAAWRVVLEPDRPLVWSWHYDYLCEWLQMVDEGKTRHVSVDFSGDKATSVSSQ